MAFIPSSIHRRNALIALAAFVFVPHSSRAAFTDATASYGLVVPSTMSYSATAPDIDGDGNPDLYVGNHWKGPADLYRSLPGLGLVEDDEQYGTGNSDRHDQIWADFDNDGDPDQYVSHGAGHPGTQAKELFWNLGNTTFVEDAQGAGVNDIFGRGRECTAADFNQDGLLDLFVANDVRPGFVRPNRLYWNNGDQTFTEHPNDDPLFVTRLHVSSVDYDLDGYPDLCVSTPHFHPGELYRNQGDSTFVDVTASAFPGISEPFREAQGTSWADYDDDGDLDLFAAGGNFGFWDFFELESDSIRYYGACSPAETKVIRFRTAGDTVQVFTQKSDFLFPVCYFGGSGSNTTTFPSTFALSAIGGIPPAILQDLEGVFVWSAPASGGLDSVYVVIRAKSNAAAEFGGHVRMSAPGISTFRADNFQLPPPFTMADWSNRLFRNNANGTFTEVTSLAFAVNNPTFNSSSSCWGDYDNDGDVDLFVSNAGTVDVLDQADYLYRNNGNGTFSEVAAAEGVQGPSEGMSDGGSFVDLNDDGYLDLFTNHGAEHPPFGIGPRRFYVNERSGNHWMMLELQGIQSNGSGIGARLRFAGPSGVNWRTVLGDTDNGFAGFTGVHVGLGQDAACDSVQIFWPSGIVDTHYDVAADAKYFAIEGEPLRPLANPLLELGFTAYADTISETATFAIPLPMSNPGGAALHYTTTAVSCTGEPISWLSLGTPAGDIWPGSTPEVELRIQPETLPYGNTAGESFSRRTRRTTRTRSRWIFSCSIRRCLRRRACRQCSPSPWGLRGRIRSREMRKSPWRCRAAETWTWGFSTWPGIASSVWPAGSWRPDRMRSRGMAGTSAGAGPPPGGTSCGPCSATRSARKSSSFWTDARFSSRTCGRRPSTEREDLQNHDVRRRRALHSLQVHGLCRGLSGRGVQGREEQPRHRSGDLRGLRPLRPGMPRGRDLLRGQPSGEVGALQGDQRALLPGVAGDLRTERSPGRRRSVEGRGSQGRSVRSRSRRRRLSPKS